MKYRFSQVYIFEMNILRVNCKDRVVKDCKDAVNITTCVRFVSFMKRGFKENPVHKSWPLLYCFSSGDSQLFQCVHKRLSNTLQQSVFSRKIHIIVQLSSSANGPQGNADLIQDWYGTVGKHLTSLQRLQKSIPAPGHQGCNGNYTGSELAVGVSKKINRVLKYKHSTAT